jgi:hypothetical protein
MPPSHPIEGRIDFATLKTRVAIPVALLVVGVAAAILVLIANDVTWKAIWVGLASTTLTASLVDLSGLLEARRREQAVLRLVGVRVGEIHRELLRIINTLFDLTYQDAVEVVAILRQLPRENRVELAAPMPNMAPPISKQDYVMQCVRGINLAFDEALSLGAVTGQAQRMQRLDNVLRSGTFLGILRSAVPNSLVLGFPALAANQALADAAADDLDAVQVEFRFFANQAGSQWKFGKL